MDQIQKVLSAASTGDEDMMKSYISAGNINNCLDEEGSTPLMYAAANGHEKIVRMLLQNDVDIDQKNCYGWTALLQASCYGHREVVYTLLQQGAQINVGNSWGTTALVAACQGKFVSIVQDLLDRGAGINTADEVASVTPLMAAAQCGSEIIVENLLSVGSNPNARLSITGWTALMLGALNNHVGVIRVLLNQGAVREMRDVNNNRAIDLAIALKHDKVVAILSEDDTVSSTTDIDIFDVVKQSNMEMLQEVISKYKVSGTIVDKDGATPLMYAARKSNIQICQLLIDSGADIDAQDYYHGWTAFMHAVHHKQHSIAQLLAENGANVTLKAKNGSSAFDIANLIGDVEMIHLIAQVTIQNLSKKDNLKITISPLPTVTEEAPPPSPPPLVEPEIIEDEEIEKDVSSTEAILRRLSNAYLASGTPNLLENQDEKGFLHPRNRRSAFSPSPDPEPHQILPAVTKPFQPRPLSPLHSRPLSPLQPRPLSPHSPIKNIAPPPPIQIQTEVSSTSMKPIVKSSKKLPKLEFMFSGNIPSKTGSSSSRIGMTSSNMSSRQVSNSNNSYLSKSSNTTSNSLRPPLSPIKSPRSLTAFKFPDITSHSSSTSSKGGGTHSYHDIGATRRDGFKLHPRTPLGEHRTSSSSSRNNQSKTKTSKTLLPLKLKPLSHKGPDLKTALENSSLGQYYNIFKEQEMDTSTFLTLSEHDFIDLGVSNSQDRTHLLALSNRLRELQSPRSPRSPKSPIRLAGTTFQYALQ